MMNAKNNMKVDVTEAARKYASNTDLEALGRKIRAARDRYYPGREQEVVYLNLSEPGQRSHYTARVQGDHITIGLLEEFVPEDMAVTPDALQALGDADLHMLRDAIRQAVPAGEDYAEMSYGVPGSQVGLFVVVRGDKIEVGLPGDFQQINAKKITVTDKARKI